ncbi:hypothetical protein FACS1894167_12640 [Synergistales bacterium]|nr:hypothetical protein FACS1894167_12640 [Synergistales bacterium]
MQGVDRENAMGKVIMICGRIGSGKTTYAEKLMDDGRDYYTEQNELFSLYNDDRHTSNRAIRRLTTSPTTPERSRRKPRR